MVFFVVFFVCCEKFSAKGTNIQIKEVAKETRGERLWLLSFFFFFLLFKLDRIALSW